MSQAWNLGYKIDELVHVQSENIEIGWQGCQQMHRQVSVTLLCMHKVFPTGRGKQMIMTSLEWHHESSVYVEGRGVYNENVHEPWVYHLGFGSWSFWQPSESHWPSVAATSVPLKECEYSRTGECLHLFMSQCPRLSLVPFVSLTGVVCRLTGYFSNSIHSNPVLKLAQTASFWSEWHRWDNLLHWWAHKTM